jgi:uncharacterized membrane protein YqjE
VETPGTTSRLWEGASAVLKTALAIIENRVKLFSLELQEEKLRLVHILLLAAAVASFGVITLTLATITIVFLFWQEARLGVLVGLCAFHLLATLVAWRLLQKKIALNRPLAGTLDELKKDQENL